MFVVWVLVVLIALSVHEFSHALAGTLLGDPTAKRLGRLTLNPIAHVDPFGLIALVTVGFGWGKPVPYNPYNLRDHTWGPVKVALAGPAMNLAVAVLLGFVLRLLGPVLGETNLLIQFLYLSVYLNVVLLLFNLLPLPPLDGSKLLLSSLSAPKWIGLRTWLETRGSWLLVGLIVADMVLGLNLFGALFDLTDGFIRIVVGI